MTTATVTKATSKYTAQHVAAMKAAAPLNLAKCAELAATDLFKNGGITARGIGAKALSEGIDYQRKEPVTKTGEPVADKADIVDELAVLLGVRQIASLAKADKAALRIVLEAVKGLNT